MRVLIGCLQFLKFTGSEMYVLELAKQLKILNYDIDIAAARIGEPLLSIAKQYDINCYTLEQLPLKTYDIMHCQHTPVVDFLTRKYPSVSKVSTIHSEIIPLEYPVKHSSIKKYIAIRPEIKDFIIKKFEINKDDIEVIYNPVDETRFTFKETKEHNSVLFVGTLDYLRKDTIFDLIKYTKQSNKQLWLIGHDHGDFVSELTKHEHVFYQDASSDVEKYVQRCDETAGILLGRTTIEGWMCSKPGWIYEVDDRGKILKKQLHEPPQDISKFYASNVAKQIKVIYENIA
jgi:glycosyltransferase involved in cell wall biosynthesis